MLRRSQSMGKCGKATQARVVSLTFLLFVLFGLYMYWYKLWAKQNYLHVIE